MKRLALVFLFIFSFCCQGAKADPTPSCVSGSLSSVIAIGTCDIGSLQFTFGNMFNANSSFDNTTGSYIYNSPWTASMFDFTVLGNGFTITFLGGSQSITAPTNGIALDYAQLPLSVVGLGVQLTGETVSGGELGLTGSNRSFAYYLGEVGCDPHCSALVVGQTQVVLDHGVVSVINHQNFLQGKPFSSGVGAAVPFELAALNGNGASWDGTPTTFTFATQPALITPEPNTMLLFGTGLTVIAAAVRRKLKSGD